MGLELRTAPTPRGESGLARVLPLLAEEGSAGGLGASVCRVAGPGAPPGGLRGKAHRARQTFTGFRTQGTLGLPIFVHFPPAVEHSHLPYRSGGGCGGRVQMRSAGEPPPRRPTSRQPLPTLAASSWAARSPADQSGRCARPTSKQASQGYALELDQNVPLQTQIITLT